MVTLKPAPASPPLPKRRHHINNPHVAAALLFHRRQPRIARIDPLRHDLVR